MKLPATTCIDRREWILENCRGRRVLHLGCTDYPFTKQRYQTAQLLHLELMRVASLVHGVDLDADSIQWLRDQGIPNLHVHNCEQLNPAAVGGQYDIILAGELIEHVSNVGKLLDSAHSCLTSAGVLLLTTINAFPIKRLPRLLWGVEDVHPDHLYYFSYSTLTTLLTRHGWTVDSLHVYWAEYGRHSRQANRFLRACACWRWFGDGFAVQARPRRDPLAGLPSPAAATG